MWALLLLLAAGPATPSRLQVVGPGGSAVEGAEVQVVDPDARDPASDLRRTDGSGRVDLGVLADETWLLITAPGYLTWTGRAVPDEGGDIRVVLREAARLRLGLRALDAGPLVEATARLLRGEEPVALGRADAEGAVALEELEPGLYRLEVSAEGCIPEEREIVLRAGESAWREVELRRRASLDVTVLGPEGEPIEGAELAIVTEGQDGRRIPEDLRSSAEEMEARTDARGRASLEPLAAGIPYRTVARHPGLPPRSLRLAPEPGPQSALVKLTRGGGIRTVVQDGERRPLPGARVHLGSDDAVDLDLVDDPEPSDDEGRLVLEALPAGTYSLRITRGGRRPRTLRRVAVRAGEVTDLGETELLPGLEVSGVVRERGGPPIGGAEITAHFYEEGRRLEATATSDGEGAFTLSGLPEGEIDLAARAEGYLSVEREGVPSDAADIVLELDAGAGVTGVVLDAETGSPVPRFRVELEPRDRGWARERRWFPEEGSEEDVSDPGGRFELMGFRPGDYYLRVVAPGYGAAREELEIVAGAPRDVEVELDPGRVVEGVVLEGETRFPVSGAKVSAPGAWPTESDAEGWFRLQGLGSDPVPLRIDHRGYVPAIVPNVIPGSGEPLEVELEAGGAVAGTVWEREGRVLPGALVTVSKDRFRRSATTDAEGSYRVEGVPEGTVGVQKVDAPGELRGIQQRTARVRKDETTRIDFGSGGRLYGVVTHEGAPASGALLTFAEVFLSGPSEGAGIGTAEMRSARADESGAWELRGIEPGLYGMTVRWEGRRTGRKVRVPEGGEERIDVALRDLWIEGRVVEVETGRPIPEAHVWATRKDPTIEPSGFSYITSRSGPGDREEYAFASDPQTTASSATDGGFRLPVAQEGTWTVFAFEGGYRMDSFPDIEVADSVSDLVLEMSPAVKLEVRLQDEAGGDLRRTWVSVRSERGTMTHCDTHEVARMESLRPGPVTVVAGAEDRAPRVESVVLEENRHEVTLRLGRGGSLRVRLPEWAPTGAAELDAAGFDVTGAEGIDLIDPGICGGGGGSFETGPHEVLVPHLPAGVLTVGLGGGETGRPRVEAPVTITESVEAFVDLR